MRTESLGGVGADPQGQTPSAGQPDPDSVTACRVDLSLITYLASVLINGDAPCA